MPDYIDAFTFPIPSAHLASYQPMAAAVAEIWLEHGALDYREYVGDTDTLPGTRGFPETVAAGPDDVVVFGWVTFPDRATRDRANALVADDPRMSNIMAGSSTGFDPTRMVYGGFQALTRVSAASG